MNEIIYKNGGTATSSFGNRLAGKVAVVTGASSGIGEATARELARLGACVVLAARRFDRLQAISDEIASTGGGRIPYRDGRNQVVRFETSGRSREGVIRSSGLRG